MEAFLPEILESLDAHDMSVFPQGAGFRATSAFGETLLTPSDGLLTIELEARSGASLNRIRHSITGLIGFVAKSEQLEIEWEGDRVGKTFPPDLRILTVCDIQRLTPRMRRVVFHGEDLQRFDVRDQIHTRLLFQPEGADRPEWPMLDDAGCIIWPSGEQQLGSRVYTIRHVDGADGTMTIDFYDHGDTGPGTQWLRRVRPGDIVGALGPAAHGPKPARRMLLAGDETGLPGIARILEAAADDLEGLAIIEVADRAEEQAFEKPEKVEVLWLYREDGEGGLLADRVRSWDWPADHSELFVWIGCEYHDFRTIRLFLRDEVKLHKSRIVAFSHWRRGMSEEDIVAAGGKAVAA